VKQRIAAGAIVIDDVRVLLVHHLRPGLFDFWVPPGGGVTGEEPLPQAASREVREETGLDVEIVRLAYIDELVIGDTRQCKFWYLARTRIEQDISIASAAAKAEHIVEAAFLTHADFEGKTIFPHVLRDEFWGHLRDGFARPYYLGVRRAEVDYPSER
jgi:8-oxo-dGTP diphosphatase